MGWRLAADDRVCAWTSGGALYGRAPERLRGLIEVRGLGVLPEPALPFVRIVLAAQAAALVERTPEPGRCSPQGVALAAVELDFHAPSAPDKLSRALDGALRGRL